MIKSFTRAGYSYGSATSVGTGGSIITLGTHADSSNAATVPNFANLRTLEVQIESMSGPPTTLKMYLARDTEGDVMLTPGRTSGATQTIQAGKTTANTGSVVFNIDTDYHYDTELGTTLCPGDTLYAVLLTDTGTLTAKVRLTWRA